MTHIWRSMPLRLALALVVLFTTVSLLSLAASYAVTRSAFEQAIRDDLAQDIAGFRAAPSAGAVALLVQAESRDTDPDRLVLSYVSPSGKLFGNGAIARDGEGFHIMSLEKGGAALEGAYLALSTQLYGGQLTVARSRAEIEALRPVFVNILLVSLLPTVLIALWGGVILARRSNRHVKVIGTALERLTGGDLAARVTPGPRWADDLRRIGTAVNGMAEAQERSVTALRQVSSDIAHDLKTPVQRVSVRLEALAETLDDDTPARDLVAQAQAEVDEIAATFQSLLQLAQMENGALRKSFAPLDMTALCRTMAEVYEPAASAKDQRIDLTLPDAPVMLTGERNLLGQMIANLIENALRHTPKGSHVGVELRTLQDAVVLSVTDDGPGVPEEERAAVLQRLYRLDRSRNTPGNGIGLSLVDGVARLHGASLRLMDAGPGLRVEVHFAKG